MVVPTFSFIGTAAGAQSEDSSAVANATVALIAAPSSVQALYGDRVAHYRAFVSSHSLTNPQLRAWENSGA